MENISTTISEQDFDAYQMAEINAGQEAGLDISQYADPGFMAIQMHQIRLGLEAGLDVSVYARPEYDWFQMEEIRRGMAADIDYTIYSSPSLDYGRMRQIRKGLEQGIDLSRFAQLDSGLLRELRKALLHKINITDYIKEGYVVEQLEQIRPALEDGIDIRPYLTNEFRGSAIREIYLGLKHGLDPAVYAKIEFHWQQMREIRIGMENRIDITWYTNSLYSWQQMREIRLGLENGLDVTPYRSLMYPAEEMKAIRERISKEELQGILSDKQEVMHLQNFTVILSLDEMEAYLEVQGGRDDTFTEDDILHILKENNIVQGLLTDEIHRLVEKKIFNQSICVAKGERPAQGGDGWYEFLFNTEPDRTPKLYPDGSVDYRNIKWYETVENGQEIAIYHPAEFGTPGYTVTGKLLPAKKGKEQSILSGKGFMLMPDNITYIATIAGKIELNDNTIDISKLCILEDVTFATGNIEFDGCVYVRGNVGAGSFIQATGDVIINGAVEGATIRSGGEVLLRQGMNGAGHGCIEAQTRVTAGFFEATQVISHGDIQANYCLNCNLYAQNKIIIHGTKGMIAGGTAQALKEIRAFHIGNHVGIHTELRLGVDTATIRKEKQIQEKIAEANKQLAILGQAYIDFQNKYPPEVRNTMEMFLKIESAIYTKELDLESLHKKQSKLQHKIKNMKGAKAVVAGNLFEGTSIYIDNIKWISPGVSRVTVKKEKGQIYTYKN